MRLVALTLLVLSLAPAASAHRIGQWSPGADNARNAIYWAWCGHRYVECWEGAQAERVSSCETGGTFSVWAENGQYLGLFQMGSFARGRYGHSSNPWGQAVAAHRYYLDSGWSPWECKP